MKKGRFIFDERPLRKEELNRLVLLNKIYHSHTKKILQDIKANSEKSKTIKKIIDIGAGTGHTTMLLKEVFPAAKVTYFDISKELLKYAKNYANEKRIHIEYIRGDINSYIFKAKYDLVFSRFALKHFFDPKKAIDIMTDILNDNGIICLIDKDVYANIWYPNFPLYKTKFMNALNKYNKLEYRGGDSAIGRKMRNYLVSRGIDIVNENIILFNLNSRNPDIKTYKDIYIKVYENLIPELVNKNLITYEQAMQDIAKLKDFINEPKNTSIIVDFVIWGEKNA